MSMKYNPISGQFDQVISYWSKNGTVLSPKSSERVDLSEIRAKDGNGLKLYDDGGAGIFIKDGGNIGINQNNPACKLHIEDGAILAEGTTGGTPASGAGARMMWIPAKKAFRAGQVTGTQWDDANIGDYSFATGYESKAGGTGCACYGGFGDASGGFLGYATHFGSGGVASGFFSTHFGQNGVASGHQSAHFGYSGVASGLYSTHFGVQGVAGGRYSWVGGRFMQLSADANSSFAWGYHNSAIALTQPNTFYIFPGGTAGKVAIGTQTPATSAIMDLTSATGALLLPRMTTAQRNALTAVNGMTLYNSTLNKVQVYEGGAWASVI